MDFSSFFRPDNPFFYGGPPAPPPPTPFDPGVVQRQAIGRGLLGAPLGDFGAMARSIGGGFQARGQAEMANRQAMAEYEAQRAKAEQEAQDRALAIQLKLADEARDREKHLWGREDREQTSQQRRERISKHRALLGTIPAQYRAEAELQVGTDAFDKLLAYAREVSEPVTTTPGPLGSQVVTRGKWEQLVRPPAQPKPDRAPKIVEIDGVKMQQSASGQLSRVPSAPAGEKRLSPLEWQQAVDRRTGQLFNQLAKGVGDPSIDTTAAEKIPALQAQAREQAISELLPYRPKVSTDIDVEQTAQVIMSQLGDAVPLEKRAAALELTRGALRQGADPAELIRELLEKF